MAINPPIIKNDKDQPVPLRIDGEHFILERSEIKFEIVIPFMGKMMGSGMCTMTSSRMVLVNNDDK